MRIMSLLLRSRLSLKPDVARSVALINGCTLATCFAFVAGTFVTGNNLFAQAGKSPVESAAKPESTSTESKAEPIDAEAPEKLFEPREYTGTSGQTLKYRLLKPIGYNADRKYPVVIFLHGAGERGDDNVAQLTHGMREFCRAQWREKYPCYVIAPQCPNGKKWSEVDWSAPSSELPEKPSDPMQLTLELIDTMIADAAVNSNRIYITGLSMGGYGTWDAIARRPDFFAAAIPICGGGDPKTAAKFVKVPLWCFHGDDDKAVPVKRSREMIEALKAAGGEPKYTEYPGVGHDSWTRSYANPEVIEWLFKQLRSQAGEAK